MGDDLQDGYGGGGGLLGHDDPAAVTIENPQGGSPFLLIGDHAGNAIPQALGDLGLPAPERVRHIAWDIGVAALGAALARRLDARFVRQTYSRLVIDCNRDPDGIDAVPAASDGTVIPGNAGLTEADRAARIAAIHAPYQQAIAAEIGGRPEPVLVSLHSFTPRMAGQMADAPRPWHIGVLHDGRRDDVARGLLGHLAARRDIVVGDNQPYRMDATDHTVPRHAFVGGLRYVELEIRQDLLAADPERFAALLAEALPPLISGPVRP